MAEGTGQAGGGLAPWGEAALDAIRFGWGDAYLIGHDDERGYWARRRDGLGGDITAPDPQGLREQVAENYAMRRVERDVSAEEATVP